MEYIYKQLGFEQSNILENSYGIKIYIGTKGEDDWCVEIPKWLLKKRCSDYDYKTNLMFYLITENKALKIANEYTEFAKRISN